ncbi:unnamed protein product [Phaeothamnion confervicola]
MWRCGSGSCRDTSWCRRSSGPSCRPSTPRCRRRPAASTAAASSCGDFRSAAAIFRTSGACPVADPVQNEAAAAHWRRRPVATCFFWPRRLVALSCSAVKSENNEAAPGKVAGVTWWRGKKGGHVKPPFSFFGADEKKRRISFKGVRLAGAGSDQCPLGGRPERLEVRYRNVGGRWAGLLGGGGTWPSSWWPPVGARTCGASCRLPAPVLPHVTGRGK